jgi:hypothetical protein
VRERARAGVAGGQRGGRGERGALSKGGQVDGEDGGGGGRDRGAGTTADQPRAGVRGEIGGCGAVRTEGVDAPMLAHCQAHLGALPSARHFLPVAVSALSAPGERTALRRISAL